MTSNPARGDFDPVPSTRDPSTVSVAVEPAVGRRRRGAGRPGGRGRRATRRPGHRRRPPGGRRLHRRRRPVPGLPGRGRAGARRRGDRRRRDGRPHPGPRPRRRLRPQRAAAQDAGRRAARTATWASRRATSHRWSSKGCSSPGGGSSSAPVATSRRSTRADHRGAGGRGRRGPRGCRARRERSRARRPSAGTWPTARRPRCPPPGWARSRSSSRPAAGLEVEVFGEQELIEMGCGGILGVNLGSVDEPRLIKMTLPRPTSPTGHLGLVGKGVMYDSGGISLKPSDESHAQMKNDMTGAAAILGAMTALQDLGCTAAVTAYLCCTDNMPSGSAMKLGDVLTDAQREDRRGPQHRRRGTPGDGRRAVPGGRGRRRRRRRHRHPDRCLPAHLRRRHRRRDGQPRAAGASSSSGPVRSPTSRSGSCRSTAPTGPSSTPRSPT